MRKLIIWSTQKMLSNGGVTDGLFGSWNVRSLLICNNFSTVLEESLLVYFSEELR